MLLVAYPSEKTSKKDEVAWITNRTRRNTSNGTQTLIISTYRTIEKKDFSELLTGKLVLYAEIIPDATPRLVDEKSFEIDDRLPDIYVFLSQLIENAEKVQSPLEIIFCNFSALIHNSGDKEVYRLVTKTLKLSNKTNLILLVYQNSHTKKYGRNSRNKQIK